VPKWFKKVKHIDTVDHIENHIEKAIVFYVPMWFKKAIVPYVPMWFKKVKHIDTVDHIESHIEKAIAFYVPMWFKKAIVFYVPIWFKKVKHIETIGKDNVPYLAKVAGTSCA